MINLTPLKEQYNCKICGFHSRHEASKFNSAGTMCLPCNNFVRRGIIKLNWR